MADAERFLAVGTVRRPHGVRGEVVVALETDRPGIVFRAGRVFLLGDARGQPSGGQVTVQKSRPFKDGMLVTFVEFTGRTPEMESLRGHTLLIPIAEAAPAAPDEVHYRDLVGMAVLVEGARVGRIRAVLETAAGELLAVQRPQGKELLLPFVKDWVRRVDPKAGELEIDPPAGLLEL